MVLKNVLEENAGDTEENKAKLFQEEHVKLGIKILLTKTMDISHQGMPQKVLEITIIAEILKVKRYGVILQIKR